MSKSILVIDTPEVCFDCPLLYEIEFDGVPYEYGCGLNRKSISTDEVDIKSRIGVY